MIHKCKLKPGKNQRVQHPKQSGVKDLTEGIILLFIFTYRADQHSSERD